MDCIYDNYNAAIKKLARSIKNGEVETHDVSTLTYYGMKLIGAIDKMQRAIQYSPTVYQYQLRDDIDFLREALAILKEKVKSSDVGDGSIYFSHLTDDEVLRDHPFIKKLNDCKLKGLTLHRAVKVTSNSTGAPVMAIENFIKVNGVKYPSIEDSSVEYYEGQEDAKRLAKSKIMDVANKMYESQQQFLRKYPRRTMDSMSYMAGFSSIANGAFSQRFLENEALKGDFLSKVDSYL